MTEMITQNFVVLDLETTGLDPKKDKIIEIGALRIEEGEIKDQFQSFVNPGRAISEEVTRLTGITDQMVANAPYIDEVLPKFLAFENNGIIMAHHIPFDYAFLKRSMVDCGFTYERKGIDTLILARQLLPENEKKTLVSLCHYLGIEHNPHRALDDAKACYYVYEKLVHLAKQNEELEPSRNTNDRFKDTNIFCPKDLIYKVKKQGRITNQQLEQIDKLLEYHDIAAAYKNNKSKEYVDFNKMTKNEASRFIDKTILKYGRIPKLK